MKNSRPPLLISRYNLWIKSHLLKLKKNNNNSTSKEIPPRRKTRKIKIKPFIFPKKTKQKLSKSQRKPRQTGYYTSLEKGGKTANCHTLWSSRYPPSPLGGARRNHRFFGGRPVITVAGNERVHLKSHLGNLFFLTPLPPL